MWARVVEIMLGCWLLVSPFVFGHPSDDAVAWGIDFAAGSLVILLGLLSFWRPARWAHLALLLVAAGLIAGAYARSGESALASAQNHMSIGVLLLMFAIIPNDASQPPHGWRRTLPAPERQG